MTNPNAFHYVDCGLDYIYLENGFEIIETPYGNGYKIHAVEELHGAIALSIALGTAPIRGQELRFLRDMLGLSQTHIAQMLGTTRPTLARWEAQRTGNIPKTSARLLRTIYGLKTDGEKAIEKIIALLNKLDDLEHGVAHEHFVEKDGEWMKAA